MRDRQGRDWTGWGWFALAGLTVVIAALFVFTDVNASDSDDSPSCAEVSAAIDADLDEDEDESNLTDYERECEGARGDRWSMATGTLVVGAFLLAAGIRQRGEYGLNERIVAGFALLALAGALLVWPQSGDGERRDPECGSMLFRGSETILEVDTDDDIGESDHERLAECGARRTTRLAWVAVIGVAGTLTLAARRRDE